MPNNRDVFETLVKRTVHNVLFVKPSRQSSSADHRPGVLPATSTSFTNQVAVTNERAISILDPGSLLHSLLSDNNTKVDGSAQDDEANSEQHAWALECLNWPIRRLRDEKAIIKRYLQKQHSNQPQHTSKVCTELFAVHEVYALLKLLLIERDPVYRQHVLASSTSSSEFLTSLHALLTLYATHFEHIHGRQISEEGDVKPIQTLYNLFLAQNCVSDSS